MAEFPSSFSLAPRPADIFPPAALGLLSSLASPSGSLSILFIFPGLAARLRPVKLFKFLYIPFTCWRECSLRFCLIYSCAQPFVSSNFCEFSCSFRRPRGALPGRLFVFVPFNQLCLWILRGTLLQNPLKHPCGCLKYLCANKKQWYKVKLCT